MEGLSGQGGADMGTSAEDLFSHFFGGMGGMGGMFGGAQGPSGPRKSKDIAHAIKATLEDLYAGKIAKLALKKTVLCKSCDGKGGKEGAVKTCHGCKGQGIRFVTRQMGHIIQKFQTVCPDCNGEGQIINAKDRCKVCLGKKTTEEQKILQVHVDKGMTNGQRIVFQGEGDQGPNIIPGDVIFIVDEQPHERFDRKGDDLHTNVKIDLLTALAGGSFGIKHLDGEWLKVEIIPGEVISPGCIKIIEGKGMPSYRHHNFGNMVVKFDIEFPAANFATQEQMMALEAVLPSRPKLAIPADANVEEVILADADPSKYSSSGQPMEEDEDEDMHGGAERVQCASQ